MLRYIKKIQPAGMTLAAKDSLPIRDKSSLFVVFLLVVIHCRNNDVSASNLSWGRCSSIVAGLSIMIDQTLISIFLSLS